jgi:hypothetical protein
MKYLLTKLLGVEAQTKALDQQKIYIVFGNDMDGFMGWMALDLKKDEILKVLPLLLNISFVSRNLES